MRGVSCAMLRHALAVLVIALFAILGAATSAPSSEPATPLSSFHEHLSAGRAYAEGPQAQVIADGVLARLSGDADLSPAVGVRVAAGQERSIVVVVYFTEGEYDFFLGLKTNGREREVAALRDQLDSILASVDASSSARGDRLLIAMRTRSGYRSFLFRRPGEQPSYGFDDPGTPELVQSFLETPQRPPR
jgi:hypothetical protein